MLCWPLQSCCCRRFFLGRNGVPSPIYSGICGQRLSMRLKSVAEWEDLCRELTFLLACRLQKGLLLDNTARPPPQPRTLDEVYPFSGGVGFLLFTFGVFEQNHQFILHQWQKLAPKCEHLSACRSHCSTQPVWSGETWVVLWIIYDDLLERWGF